MKVQSATTPTAAAQPAGSPYVDQIMRVEEVRVEGAKARLGSVVEEKNEYSKLSGILNSLDGFVSGMKVPSGFTQLKLDSSHPDILDGQITGPANPGTYEFEIRGLAVADKYLEAGFPDKDQTQVGFGFMAIERDDGGLQEMIVNPGSTLQDVANQINGSNVGVKAMVVNSGIGEDPFRLMVTSEKTGDAAKVHIDEDTTFLNMSHLKQGRNLDAMFEDVQVSRDSNKLTDLLDGVNLDAKRSEPGTRIQINVSHDIDKTFDLVREFTSKYNEVARFSQQQFTLDPDSERLGPVADSTTRGIIRNLQSAVSAPAGSGSKYATLAQIGVTTNAKSGELEVDEKKLKDALAKDYEGVAKLFTVSEGGEGLASRMSNALRNFRDPVHGVLKNRIAGLDATIKNQNKAIDEQTKRVDQKRVELEQKFARLDQHVESLNAQGQYLQSRFPQQGPG